MNATIGGTMKRLSILLALVVLGLVLAATAQANRRNSIQPAHVYFGRVQSGVHPQRLVRLHNGTDRDQTIATINVSGSGGYVFTLPGHSPLLAGRSVCAVGTTLADGQSCYLAVRVHTRRAGWFRSSLSVVYATGWFNSAELRAHVV